MAASFDRHGKLIVAGTYKGKVMIFFFPSTILVLCLQVLIIDAYKLEVSFHLI